MPRRALRPSFVVTFALGAAALAGGCRSNDAGNGPGNGACPAEVPTPGARCDTSGPCYYDAGCGSPYAYCQQGTWTVMPSACNPPGLVPDAAADASDISPDGAGQDGGDVRDATGDVAQDAESE